MKNINLFTMALAAILISSCGGNNTNTNKNEERSVIYMVGHSNDVGKYGEGTYINTNSEYTCPHCGMRVSRDNIFHDCQ